MCVRNQRGQERDFFSHNPLLSSNRKRFSLSRALTCLSRHNSDIVGPQALRTWTGSSGSSHQPSISPEWGLLGLLDLLPSANSFFQLVEVWIMTSFLPEEPLLEDRLEEILLVVDEYVCCLWGIMIVGAGRPFGVEVWAALEGGSTENCCCQWYCWTGSSSSGDESMRIRRSSSSMRGSSFCR